MTEKPTTFLRYSLLTVGLLAQHMGFASAIDPLTDDQLINNDFNMPAVALIGQGGSGGGAVFGGGGGGAGGNIDQSNGSGLPGISGSSGLATFPGPGGAPGSGSAVGTTCSGSICGAATGVIGSHGFSGGPANGTITSGSATVGAGGGGGGGAGGSGTVVTTASASSVIFSANVTSKGGSGGDGGTGGAATGSAIGGGLIQVGGGGGGGGGAGGHGIFVKNNLTLTLETMTSAIGGAGGMGGIGGQALCQSPGVCTGAFGDGGAGGQGGIGVYMPNGGTLINLGAIKGGNGGNVGAGGEGVIGANLAVVDSGSIVGGLGKVGTGARADAIQFTGGVNSLALQAGFVITGNVVGVVGGSDTLILGGATNSTFDASLIGPQYQNFANFQKIDPSTWTLINTTTALTPWVVTGGTLAISNDAALGSSSGALTLNGGTLQTITNPVISTRSVILGGSGGTFQTDSNLTLNGIVSGAGMLTKTGAGLLLLKNGSNSYTGGTTVNAGTLQAGMQGGFVNNTPYTVNGGTLDLNNFNLIASSLSGTGGTINLGSGNLTINQSINTTYAGSFTGTGQLMKSGNGTLFLTGDSSTFAGMSLVNAGILEVDGTLGSDMTVATGGTLAGVGTIKGTVTVNGTIDPGDSPIGTLTVGNYIANPGSTYEVEIDPNGQSSSIHALGMATINGGTVDVEKNPGVYAPGIRYTIVTADGGRFGTYNTLIQNMPFLSFSLDYDPNHVYLDMTRNSVPFASLAATSNQFNTANAAQSLGVGNAVFNALASVSNAAEAQQAFDNLSGEAHVSLVSSMLAQESSYARDAASSRLYDAFTDPTPPCPCYTGFSVWSQGIGSWGELEGDRNASEVNSKTGGLFVGADQVINNRFLLGAMVGYTHGDVDVDQRNTHFENANYSLGVYAGTKIQHFRLAAGGLYTWHDINANRNVIFPNFANHLTADYNAQTSQVFAEAAYSLFWPRFRKFNLDLNLDLNLEPFVNLAYVNVDVDPFTEHGGPAALHGSTDVDDVVYSTLGARQHALFYQTERYSLGEKVLVGWQHAYDDTHPRGTFVFASGSQAFSIVGAPIAKDSAVIDAGVHVDNHFHTLQLRLAYIGQWARQARDNGVTGTLTWQVG